MIDQKICERVLTVGPEWKKPKGGIAQVLNSYSSIYNPFIFVTTTRGGGLIAIMTRFLIAVLSFIYNCLSKRIEIVHIHTASYNSFWRKSVFVMLSKILRRRVVLHIHGGNFKDFSGMHYKQVNFVLNRCDCVVVLSNTWKSWFENTFEGLNISIVPNIVNLPVIYKNRSVEENKLTLLFLGFINERKGIFDLLEVMSIHHDELMGKVNLIIGGNGYIQKLKDMISANSLEDMASFCGWISGEEKTAKLNSADVFILPSYAEGLPISILEAMSYGLPIISTRVGGIPEVVSDMRNGFLVTPGDKDELYNAVMFMVNNSSKRKEMGMVSKRMVEPHYPQNVAIELTNLYINLM